MRCGLAGRREQLPGPIRPVAHRRLHPVPLRGRDEQRPAILAAEHAGKARPIDGDRVEHLAVADEHNPGTWGDSELIAIDPKTHELLGGHDNRRPYGKAAGY